MLNPLLASFITGLLRQAFVGVGGYLVARGVFTADETENYIAAFIAFLIGIGWMLWRKYKDRLTFLTALSTGPITEDEAKTIVEQKLAPPVSTPTDEVPKQSFFGSGRSRKFSLLLVIGLALSLSACGARGAQVAVTAETAVHDGLSAFDNALDARCDSGALLPATCVAINKVLAPTWDAKNQLNRALRNGAVLTQIPSEVKAFRATLAALIAEVQRLVQGDALAILLAELRVADTTAVVQ